MGSSKGKKRSRSGNAAKKSRFPVGEYARQRRQTATELLSQCKRLKTARMKVSRLKEKVGLPSWIIWVIISCQCNIVFISYVRLLWWLIFFSIRLGFHNDILIIIYKTLHFLWLMWEGTCFIPIDLDKLFFKILFEESACLIGLFPLLLHVSKINTQQVFLTWVFKVSSTLHAYIVRFI